MKSLKMGFAVIVFMSGVVQPVFAGEMLNQHLPEWIKVDLEVRDRMEYKKDLDFNKAAHDTDTLYLHRTRINLQVTPVEQAKFFLQFQDARTWDQDVGAKAGNEDYADIRQGYVELSKFLEEMPMDLPEVSMRLGRQELSFGAQRLIGGFNWSNVAQTFEAGRLMLNFPELKLTVDGFGGTKTPNKSPREFDDWFQDDTKDKMGGYYATYKGIENILLEQYFIARAVDTVVSFGPSGSAHLDVYTMGGRVKGKIADTGFDYELESAKQWGQFGQKDIDAHMAVAILGYTLGDVPWTPRLAFEFDYASGDKDSSDGDLNTFNNLYPTNHLYYGYMDQASLQNINDYRLQITAKPHKKVHLQADLHMIYLDTSRDSLYTAGRAVKRTAATAGADTHVGNELDVFYKFKYNDHLAFLGGYSHFFAGDFLKDTGAHDDADFVYFESTITF